MRCSFGSPLPAPRSPLPAPRSPLPAPCSLLPAPCSLLPSPCSPLPAPCSLSPVPNYTVTVSPKPTTRPRTPRAVRRRTNSWGSSWMTGKVP